MPYFLIDKNSGEITYTPDDPAGFLARGNYRIATDDEVDRYAEEQDFGTTEQQALGLAERVGRGVTLGLGRDEISDEERARSEVGARLSPVLSGIADAVPAIGLGALASTGVGAAAVGLGAASGGLAAAGAALGAESAVAGTVAAAQAAYERGQYLGEDVGADAENALLFGGLNFGLGGLSRALFGAGKAAGEVASSELDDIAKAAEGETARDLAGAAAPGAEGAAVRLAEREAVEDGMDRALANASRSETREILEQAVSGKLPAAADDSLGRARMLYQNREAIREVSARQMASDLTDVMQGLPDLVKGGKIRDVSAAVGDNVAAQRGLANGVAEQAAQFAGALRGEARAAAAEMGRQGLDYAVPGSKGLVQSLTEHASAISEAKTGRQMFEALDAFKRTLQEHKLSLETGAENSLDPLGFQQLIPRVQTFASQVRASLEDVAVWGKAGEKQRAYNAVIHDQLMPSMRVFEQSVLKRTSRGYDGLWNTEGWEKKIGTFLQGGDVGARRHVDGVLDALDELGKLRTGFGDAAVGQRIGERVARIRRTIGLADELATASEKVEKLGTLASGVPLFGKLAREWLTGDMQNAFRRLTMSSERLVDAGVDDWIASSQARAAGGSMLGKLGAAPLRAVASHPEDSLVRQTAKRIGVSYVLADFMGQDKNPQAAFQAKRAALQSDETFFGALAGEYQSLQMLSPETYLLLAGNATKAREFLLEKMPPNVSPSMVRPEGYPPSREAIEEWAVYWDAVKRPAAVLANIRSASAAQLETVERLFPRAYERTLQRLIERIGTAEQSGRPLDDNLLMRMSMLFPVDGAVSPSFSHRAAILASDWLASQAQPQPAALPAPGVPKAPGAAAPASVAQTGATFGTIG